MTISASGYSPCAAAPVATPTVLGGGSVMPTGQPGAPTPPGSVATPSLPQPVATPGVLGGGPGATYVVQQSPVQVGTYLPAPHAASVPVGAQPTPAHAPAAAAGAPPEPMVFPGLAAQTPQKLPGTPAPVKQSLPTGPALPGQAAPTAAGSAATRANWSQWRAQFQQLGLPEKLIATIGASTMRDEELADLYVEAEDKLLGTGSTDAPGASGPTGTTGTRGTDGTAGSTTSDAGWNDSWEQRFAKLGLGAEDMALVRDEAIARGSNDAQLGQLYEELARQMATTGAGTPTGADGAPDAAGAEAVLAKHAKAGVPQAILDAYAQQAANPGGLDAALTTLTGRVHQLEERGWKAKFEKAGMAPDMLWQVAIGSDKTTGQPGGPLPTDGELQQLVTMTQRGEAGIGRNLLEAGFSLIPGVQLGQRVFGAHNTITDSDMVTEGKLGMLNNGLAALSGVALGALLLRGGRSAVNLNKGLVAARGGFAELKLATGGLAAGSTGATLAAKAAANDLSFGKAFFNNGLRREVTGMAHVEAAARQFNHGGAARLDSLTQASVRSMFDQVANGGRVVTNGDGLHPVEAVGFGVDLATTLGVGSTRMNWLPFASGPAAKLGPVKGQAGDVLSFNRKLGISDGRSQLAAIAQAGGSRLSAQTRGITDAQGDALARLSAEERTALGDVMAGRVSHELGIGRDGVPARKLRKLADGGMPPNWYGELPGASGMPRPMPGVNAGSAVSAD